jgi:hypothetical protein
MILNGAGALLHVVLALVLLALVLLVLYWVIRLAVRHAIADARRRDQIRAREDVGWDPGRR